jgi:hypothetical protein
MINTIAAYMLAFFTIGWGGGLIAIPFLPLVIALRRTRAAKALNFFTYGFGTFLATLAVTWVCMWLNVDAVYAMFVLLFFAMLFNDSQRVRRAKTAFTFAGVNFTENPELRSAIVVAETANLWADVIGFIVAIICISPMKLV